MTEAAAVFTAHALKLSGLYVTPLVTSRPSIGLITHMIQSVVMLKAFPKRSMQLEFLKWMLHTGGG